MTRIQNPRQQHRNRQQYIERHRLHRVEPDVPAETRVPHHTQVQPEEGHEARAGDGSVEVQYREDGLHEEGQFRVLREEEASVLEGVEEGQGVGRD